VKKERLDQLLVGRGLAKSLAQAQRLIRAGEVRVDQQLADKPGTQVPADALITLAARQRYASRGGEKLEAALARFELDVGGAVAADVGASTGGFTDCLLQHGAARVYAIDVGYGQLSWRLRNDPRVTVMERTNARYLKQLPEPVDLATVDVSFISLQLILPAAKLWLKPEAGVVTLIKPQFEANRQKVARGGVVRDPEIHRQVLIGCVEFAASLELGLAGLMSSPLRGPAGNVEFLAHFVLDGTGLDAEDTIATCMAEVEYE
jgi:23S rRNA (cytidine1920-2'-O)/16S rRNA (cytidine1409-2'-O)-methyltransferase